MTSEKHDIFLRAHTEVIDKPKDASDEHRPRATKNHTKWAEYALAFDVETRTDTRQELTFGFCRIMHLNGDAYELVEEVAFYDDDLPADERSILESYVSIADTGASFPPRFPLYSKTEFIKEVFYKYAHRGALIVGFNLPFDIARCACKWPEGEKKEWSLILKEDPDGSEDKIYPRVLIDPIDSKKAFISFANQWIPEDGDIMATKIGEARFLDLRTLLWALYNVAYSLKRACDNKKGPFKGQNLPQKIEHVPTGRVTLEEIEYGRQDVRCTAALLNAAKKEFDLHADIELDPDKAYSPASIAKAYLSAMNIATPEKKFEVSSEIKGFAMESYFGGRSETRIRLEEVPVVPVDFKSEYPSTCAALGLWDIITAESISFEDATEDVRALLSSINLEKCFKLKQWPDFRFFALVKPDDDVLPVRTSYNGKTQNIGNNFLSSKKSVWVAGPDPIASKIQTGKAPQIVKAIRIVPHGKQAEMKSVNLRGMVKIDPYKDDLFKRVIEQRMLSKSNKELYYWLKILANAIYGFFVELNPEALSERSSVRVHVYSGQASYEPERRFPVEEKQGPWYAPYLASLITSGGRLYLAMAEACVKEKQSIHLYGDTDSLAIVASKHGGHLRIPGSKGVKILSWVEVQAIVDRFAELNPYNREIVKGSILNLTDANFDADGNQRPLYGFSISAKRYVIYQRSGDEITIIDAKAHGLGYLHPPTDSPEKWNDEHDVPKWIFEAWEWILRKQFGLKQIDLPWLKHPQMMRMAVTTVNVLKRLHGWEGFRPWNFFLLPILADCGYPGNVDPKCFTLATSMESDQEKWIDSVCVNIGDPEDAKTYKLTTYNSEAYDSEYGKHAVIATFEDRLHRYMKHPEAKSLAPDGGPCKSDTRGLLQRAHVVAGEFHRIGKESDRRWEEGDDLESMTREPIDYDRDKKVSSEGMAKPKERLIRDIKKIKFPALIKIGCTRFLLRSICRRELVRTDTLNEYERKVKDYAI